MNIIPVENVYYAYAVGIIMTSLVIIYVYLNLKNIRSKKK